MSLPALSTGVPEIVPQRGSLGSVAGPVRTRLGPLPGRGVVVHEWINPHGGSERVFQAMARMFPAAELLCLWNDAGGSLVRDRVVRESGLARTPLRRSKIAALPVMPLVWRRQPGPAYDWALVSSHLFAHHVSFARSGPGFRKFVYVHTPARYLWEPDLDGRGGSRAARLASAPLRRLDRRRAGEADSFAANSHFVRRRMESAWDRTATVVYPPVRVSHITAVADWSTRLLDPDARIVARLPGQFLLGASRLVGYKRLDRVIDVGRAAGLPVVIAGAGPDEPALRAHARRAGIPVVFLGRVSDELLYTLYQRCVALVFPAVEDFGIMPVEAMAAGAPVLAHHEGGVAESVVDGRTGILVDFDRVGPNEMSAAVADLANLQREDCVERARQFDEPAFRNALVGWLYEAERGRA